jgi:hypothetical protein
MKHIFIIDENVTIAALTYVRPDTGARDLTSAVLINTMFINCHRFALSTATFARWSAKVQQFRAAGRALNSALTLTMRDAQVMDGKCPQPLHGDPPELPEEAESDWSEPLDDDRDFIRLAAHFTGCFLVTFDMRLREHLERLGLHVKYGFSILTPEEALPLASEPSTED